MHLFNNETAVHCTQTIINKIIALLQWIEAAEILLLALYSGSSHIRNGWGQYYFRYAICIQPRLLVHRQQGVLFYALSNVQKDSPSTRLTIEFLTRSSLDQSP